jgi:hypothetical protein
LFGFEICSDSKFSWLQNLFKLNFVFEFKICSDSKFSRFWNLFELIFCCLVSKFVRILIFVRLWNFLRFIFCPLLIFFQIVCLISKFVQIQVLFGFVICSSLKTEDLIWLICCTKTEEDFIVLVLLIEWTNGLVHLFFFASLRRPKERQVGSPGVFIRIASSESYTRSLQQPTSKSVTVGRSTTADEHGVLDSLYSGIDSFFIRNSFSFSKLCEQMHWVKRNIGTLWRNFFRTSWALILYHVNTFSKFVTKNSNIRYKII